MPIELKYFKEKEVVGLIDDLRYKLDRARGFFGYPIVITSGYRDPGKNRDVGGVKDSAHTKGMAVDIRLPADSLLRDRLIWALGRAGFDRVGVYGKHVHVDVDNTKPVPAFFAGEYNAIA